MTRDVVRYRVTYADGVRQVIEFTAWALALDSGYHAVRYTAEGISDQRVTRVEREEDGEWRPRRWPVPRPMAIMCDTSEASFPPSYPIEVWP